MAIGLDYVVPFIGDPDPSLPYASSIDARITPGSLLLLEPTHSYLPWPAGVPAAGYQAPNVAWESAAALIGSGDATTTRSTFDNTFIPAEATFERTAKGGLHGIVSRTAQGGHRGLFETAGIMPYLNANPTRPLALFIWELVTRVATSNSNMYDGGIGDNASFSSRYQFQTRLANATGAQRIAMSAPTGRTGGDQTQARLWPVSWGNLPPFNSLNSNDGRSFVFYSAHLVDVLASGLTFAQLDAIDAAAFAEAFGAGGRFNGDTWSNPDSVIAS